MSHNPEGLTPEEGEEALANYQGTPIAFKHRDPEALAERAFQLALRVNQLERQRDEALKLHVEFEGRCTHCCEFCDCLDKDPCTHGNLPWPCPTARIYLRDAA